MSPARISGVVVISLLLAGCATMNAQQSPATPAAPTTAPPAAAATPGPALRELNIKWVRDSQEYATLARQAYRMATDAVTRVAPAQKGRHWTVVLDVDETALDNSTYQLDRAAYGLAFEPDSWGAWIRRREAAAVPGVVAFVAAVRKAGGHIAWITNRDNVEADPTRDNLRTVGLWNDDDRLCTQRDSKHTKRMRREEVRAGNGACAWSGSASVIVAFVGDQMGDFPEATEPPADAAGDNAFGRSSFLIPNPMYGGWTSRVTRTP